MKLIDYDEFFDEISAKLAECDGYEEAIRYLEQRLAETPEDEYYFCPNPLCPAHQVRESLKDMLESARTFAEKEQELRRAAQELIETGHTTIEMLPGVTIEIEAEMAPENLFQGRFSMS